MSKVSPQDFLRLRDDLCSGLGQFDPTSPKHTAKHQNNAENVGHSSSPAFGVRCLHQPQEICGHLERCKLHPFTVKKAIALLSGRSAQAKASGSSATGDRSCHLKLTKFIHMYHPATKSATNQSFPSVILTVPKLKTGVCACHTARVVFQVAIKSCPKTTQSSAMTRHLGKGNSLPQQKTPAVPVIHLLVDGIQNLQARLKDTWLLFPHQRCPKCDSCIQSCRISPGPLYGWISL